MKFVLTHPRKYEGSLIVLPAVKEHYPAREHLKWHREYVYLD